MILLSFRVFIGGSEGGKPDFFEDESEYEDVERWVRVGKDRGRVIGWLD